MKRKPQARPTARPLRADRWVKLRFPTLTGRHIVEALDEGLVVGERGKRVRKGDRLASDEILNYTALESHLASLREGNASLHAVVVHEASDFVVIDKPAGMPSHPLSLFDRDTVTHWAFAHYPGTREEFSDIQPTLAPHRLDTGTSGLLVVALTSSAYARWRERFQKKQMRKRYLAWCWGRPSENELQTEAPIGHDPKDRRRMIALRGEEAYLPPLLPARTRARVVRREEARGCFLAEVECETGVTHQVRVHLASLGFPLVGDALYDREIESRGLRPPFHLLRAVSLVGEGESYEIPIGKFHDGVDA